MSPPSLDLRVPDVLTVLAVARSGSVSIAAKERSVTPSQVSKAIQRVARIVGHELFVRRGATFVLSDVGRERIGELRAIAAIAQRLTEQRSLQRYAIAMPSFLCGAYAGAVARALEPHALRVLELAQRSIEAYASSSFFELALSAGPLSLPDLWASMQVAEIRFGIFTTPRARATLSAAPTVDEVAKLPFVLPVLMTTGEILPGEDGCPIPRERRIAGHEADTVRAALDLAACTDHVVYGPVMAASPWLESGRLVRIEGEGLDRSLPLHLHVHGERITGIVQRRIAAAVAE